MLFDSQKYPREKIIFIGLAVVVVLLVILAGLVIWQKGKQVVPSPAGTLPKPRSAEEKQKDMLEALKEANEGAPLYPQEEQAKKRQEMQEFLKGPSWRKATSASALMSQSEQNARVQDMLNAIRAANK